MQLLFSTIILHQKILDLSSRKHVSERVSIIIVQILQQFSRPIVFQEPGGSIMDGSVDGASVGPHALLDLEKAYHGWRSYAARRLLSSLLPEFCRF